MSVLVIDDDSNRLATHAGNFRDIDENIIVIEAKNTQEAKLLIRDSAVFETILSDINFDPDDSNNFDGLYFGQHLKEIGYPAHRAAYSEYLDDDSGVIGNLQDVFDDLTLRELKQDDYKKLLKRGRESYLKKLSATRLQALEVLSLETLDIEKISRLHDTLNVSKSDLSDLYKDYVNAGYKVVVAAATNADAVTGAKFLLWSKLYDGGTYFEVHKVPELYGYGSSQDQALEMLNDVIIGLYADFSDTQKRAESNLEEGVIFDFLKLLYENA